MTGRDSETAHMPNGGMYAPPACVRLPKAGGSQRGRYVIARRSQTSQDDVCATPAKVKGKTERRKSRRVSRKRDSALLRARFLAALGMTGRGWETAHMPNGGMYAPPASVWHVCGSPKRASVFNVLRRLARRTLLGFWGRRFGRAGGRLGLLVELSKGFRFVFGDKKEL